ncbi:polyketide synthase [Saccharomonospora piscinae]|uniref:beta-ketoacyl [acyl carrier protein] synthase domain-containing protein n=1 Tax=Saccharomonospora piscinae TaxID=687388 RepID=UPI001289C6D7|nr:polyketide synthase [Saccharomonospora piscinae]TLW94657.1 polyketide synthase [Saccharomonospora piscinae]
MDVHVVGASLFLPGGVRSREDIGVVHFDSVGAGDRSTVFDDAEFAIDPVRLRISPRQARVMDPQHLVILDCVERALGDAGVRPEELAGSQTGVFVGMGESDFVHTIDVDQVADSNRSYLGIGNSRGAAAGRVSYAFDLHGPCWQVDTTCSSGLVALRHGITALATGEVDLALVVGSHLVRSEFGTMIRQVTGALSPTGQCRAFDAAADGFTIGEGVVAVVLAPESSELRSLGRVQCAVNHDGRTAGLTVPNPDAQRDVVERALRMSGLAGVDVDYVEAHGTGTPLGDPIEMAALAAAYRTADRPAPLLVGSNKPRFGHLEAASGLLSLVVAMETLRLQRPPGGAVSGQPSDRIPWAAHNIRPAIGDVDYPESIINVGVSALGLSGTNAHAIVSRSSV